MAPKTDKNDKILFFLPTAEASIDTIDNQFTLLK